jgi:hypothetical protein
MRGSPEAHGHGRNLHVRFAQRPGLWLALDVPSHARRRGCGYFDRCEPGMEEQYARVRGIREPVVVALAQPCGCLVDEHATELHQAAFNTLAAQDATAAQVS